MQPGRAARASPMSILRITSRRFRDQLRSGDRVEDKVKIRGFRLVALAAALTAGCNGSEPAVPGAGPEPGLGCTAPGSEFPLALPAPPGDPRLLGVATPGRTRPAPGVTTRTAPCPH